MKIKDWIEDVSRSGMVCSDYMRKISAAETREDMFRVLCDASGGNWLFEMHASSARSLPTTSTASASWSTRRDTRRSSTAGRRRWT